MNKVSQGNSVFFRDLTTFRIGGPISFFTEVKNEKDLKKAVRNFLEKEMLFFVLGGGSNILAPDGKFEKAVIKISGENIKFKEREVEVFSGTSLTSLVNFYKENNLSGLEWATGIPGTVGGAVRGNAGAFGRSIGDLVESVKVLFVKRKKMEEITLKPSECYFSYRDSIFKKERSFIIEKVILRFEKADRKEIERKMREYIFYRKNHQPLNFPSAGSIFKNFRGKVRNENILRKFPQLRDFNRKEVIPAGFLIEKSGLKGVKKGDIMISKKHANFIINLGNGKARDVLYLISLIKRKVKENFGIILEEEIDILENFS